MELWRTQGVDDTVLTATSVAEDDATVWTAPATFALNALAIRGHRIWESQQAGNSGHDPLLDTAGTFWADIGPTNAWAMFDAGVATQTEASDEIAVTLEPTGRIDRLALLNLAADTVQVTVSDDTDGVVYDRTVSLISTSGVTDWYAYFFEPIVRANFLALDDLPAGYSDPQIDVTITDTGATVKVGVLAVCQSRNLGGTQFGAQVGIDDYSVKSRDDFGNFTIVQRAYSDRAGFDVVIPAGQVDEVKRLMTEYRATPAIWVGDAAYGSTIIYGFAKTFEIVIQHPDVSFASMQFESLI